VRLQKQRRRDTGLAEADHQHAFSVQFHLKLNCRFLIVDSNTESRHAGGFQSTIKNQQSTITPGCGQLYLSFSVVSANSANTSDAIQKRTMIFDSDQPISSK